jgi:ribonuclease P protein component
LLPRGLAAAQLSRTHPAFRKDNVTVRSSNGRSSESVALSGNAISFPRSARLLRHADFERVYKQGRRHFSASMTVFYRLRDESSEAGGKNPVFQGVQGLRIGFTVSRALGGAVQRNRMRRRLREAVRQCRPGSGVAADVVINPKKALLTVDFAALVNEVRRAFVVIEQKLGSGSESGSRAT